MTFTITASAEGRTRTETRKAATSAAVLAMKWTADGLGDVRIESDGHSLEIVAFRQRYIKVVRGPPLGV